MCKVESGVLVSTRIRQRFKINFNFSFPWCVEGNKYLLAENQRTPGVSPSREELSSEDRYGAIAVGAKDFVQNLEGRSFFSPHCAGRLQRRHPCLGQCFDNGPVGGCIGGTVEGSGA